jgi:hypothetical protein
MQKSVPSLMGFAVLSPSYEGNFEPVAPGTTAVRGAGPASRRWQATNWPGRTSCIGGSSFEQRSKA